MTDVGGASVGTAKVTISSPASQTTLDRMTTTLIGTTDSPRTPLTVEANGSIVDGSFTTDQAGGFSVPIGDLQEGSNTVIVQLRDASDAILGQSSPLSLTVALDDSALLQSFTITPAMGLMVGDEAILEAKVGSSVTSVSLLVDGSSYPLDRTTNNTYGGMISFEDPGDYDLKIRLYVDGDMFEEDVDDIIVGGTGSNLTAGKNYRIGMIKYLVDPINPGSVILSWEPDGEISPYYTVYYGLNPESLDTHFTVSVTGATLSNLSAEDVTYVQVWPSTQTGVVLGEPSDPLVISMQAAAPQCVVKGIKLRSEQR
ncbi:MAG: hypothetical protein H6766_06405 [Candidatus Peribacteria bacterium]|nr:MAG: hypothetical protein H6766_06405 [Candidatus Peribacteria bacterium]